MAFPETYKTSGVRRSPGIPEPLEAQQHSTLTFRTGVLTGAAMSAVVPWHLLEGVGFSMRIGALAGICAGFVLLRLAFRSKAIRRTSGLVSIMVGGFLLASSQHLPAVELTSMLVAIGAAAFLCGITILLRERTPTPAERDAAIRRLLEAEAPEPDCVTGTLNQETPERSIPVESLRKYGQGGDSDIASDLASLAQSGVGIRPRFAIDVRAKQAVS